MKPINCKSMGTIKILYVFLVLTNLCSLNLAEDTAIINNLDFETYISAEYRSNFAYEFFNYIKNFSSFSLTNQLQRQVNADDHTCIIDITEIAQAITQKNLWAWRMIDSWGRVPSGLLYGRLRDMGNFDECVNIHKELNQTRSIKGKYCTLRLPLRKLYDSIISRIQIGICIPSSCKADTIDALIKDFVQNTFQQNIKSKLVNEKTCKTDEPQPIESVTIATIVFLSIFGGLALCSTLYDYFISTEGKPLPRIIKGFSIRANGRSCFRIVDNSKKPHIITCLDGIRCLSLIWVIYGHEYFLTPRFPHINIVHLYTYLPSPFFSFIDHSFFSVDTFFVMGSVLLSMIALREMDKRSGKLNIPLMYLFRYLRLTPQLVVAILIQVGLYKHFGSGPLWGTLMFEKLDNCNKNWWKTLLYIQNYTAKQFTCITQTWYLAVDTQLYFISPIFLIALWRWGKKAVAAILVFMLLLSACLFTTILTTDYSLFFRNIKNAEESSYHLYMATHVHAAPWFVGFLFGYFLHKISGKDIKLSKPMAWLGWICCLALIFTCIFSLLPKSQWGTEYSRVEEAFYVTLTRIVWPLAVCWIIFACHYGYGGFANSLLSSPLWQPMVRLSYTAYIYHLFILSINAGRLRTNTYFSDYEMMLRFWPDFGMTMLFSLAVYLFVEAPLINLISLLVPSKKPASKSKAAIEEKSNGGNVETPKVINDNSTNN